MKARIFAILAMCSYAAQNVMLDSHLKSLSPFTLVTIISGTVFSFSLIALFVRGGMGIGVDVPTSHQFLFAVLAGTLLYLADLCFFGAYNAGATMSMMTTMPVILPAIALFMKYVATGTGLPTRMVLASWVFAALTVYFVSKDTS